MSHVSFLFCEYSSVLIITDCPPLLPSPGQVLVKLCSHTAPAEELARKDDLILLFSAITSWCPQHNTMWRKSAAEVLMTLSRHGLSQPVVSYIHSEWPLLAFAWLGAQGRPEATSVFFLVL